MDRCVACGNEILIVRGKCKYCGTLEAEATGKIDRPTFNQLSGRSDEESMRCGKCGSYDIHFCYRNQSLRCKSCSSLMTYNEAIAWHQNH